MEVRPTSISNTVSYMAMSARLSYKRLNTVALGYPGKNLIEFIQRVAGGSGTGTKFLVTGGYKSAKFYVDYLADGASAVTNISNTASSDTGIVTFMLFNQFLYYTDGALAWRSWNGVTDAASGFTTITKFGIKHKSRAFYANDVTNSIPNRLWVSDVLLPETVNASNFFDIGDRSDAIIGLEDQGERILIIKEKSTWAFYLAPELTSSTLLRADEYKGSIAPLGHLWASMVTYVYTSDAGINTVDGLQYAPSVPQISNFLKGFQNSLAALGFREDQLLISTLSTSADTYNKRVFQYDLVTNKMFQQNMNIACFCSNRGISTFAKRYKAVENDGANQHIIELDQISGQAESTITAKLRTKEFTGEDISRIKKANLFILDGIFPDSTTPLTLKVYCNSVLTETKTYTPSTSGFNRTIFKLLPSTSYGNYISFQFEYAQPGTSATKFALVSGIFDFSIEPRTD